MDFSFWGGPNFSVIVLRVFLENNLRPKVVVTTPPSPFGRRKDLVKSELQILAEENAIPVLTPLRLKDQEFWATFKDFKCDFNFLTAYGKIVPPEVLELGQNGFINLHPSLLPKYRGASPIQTTILNGDKETGVSLFLMEKGMDNGSILSQKTSIIEKEDDYISLSQKLAVLGAKLALETLPKWLEGICTPQPQNELLATFTKKFTTSDGQVNWDAEDASAIVYKIKALSIEPGVYSYFKETNKEIFLVKFYEGQIISSDNLPDGKINFEPGEIININHDLVVATKKGLIKINSLQPAGKKIMTGKAFLNGHGQGHFVTEEKFNLFIPTL
jgi:methionyl-tRNA formyltransferase